MLDNTKKEIVKLAKWWAKEDKKEGINAYDETAYSDIVEHFTLNGLADEIDLKNRNDEYELIELFVNNYKESFK